MSISRVISYILLGLGLASTGVASQDPGVIQVLQHQIVELVFQAPAPADYNPWSSYPFRIRVTDPEGSSAILDPFYDGPARQLPGKHLWKARLAPSKPGLWGWATLAGDVPEAGLTGLTGTFSCAADNGPGGLLPRGRHFYLQNGQLTYLQGNFLDFHDGLTSSHVLLSHRLPSFERQQILDRQQLGHGANKINIYLANRGDYDHMSVIPWDEAQLAQGRLVLELDFWREADDLLIEVGKRGLFAEIWFFADDSDFGALPLNLKEAFYRYAMARLSAFNHTLFVIALEWNEEWSQEDVVASGRFIQRHNPWQRPLSVHSLEIYPQGGLQAFVTRVIRQYFTPPWPFAGMDWPTFIASQAGNDARVEQVNRLAVRMRRERLPHISEEFGYLRHPEDALLRAKMWANLCGGAAGGGTGSGIRGLMGFIERYRPPLDRMAPSNQLASGGGTERFVLAETGHHYLVYNPEGHFTLAHEGTGLLAQWFDPRSGRAVGSPFPVAPAGRTAFAPPSAGADWVLWVSDGHRLADIALRPDPTPATVVWTLP